MSISCLFTSVHYCPLPLPFWWRPANVELFIPGYKLAILFCLQSTDFFTYPYFGLHSSSQLSPDISISYQSASVRCPPVQPFPQCPADCVFRCIPDTHSICRWTPCRCRCVAVVCLLKMSHTTTSYSTDMKSYTFNFWISVLPDFLSINDLEYLVIPLTLLWRTVSINSNVSDDIMISIYI